MCDDLRKLGMKERKTKSLAVPAVPNAYLQEFVRGYFDGDGNVWVGRMNTGRDFPNLVILTVLPPVRSLFSRKCRGDLLV